MSDANLARYSDVISNARGFILISCATESKNRKKMGSIRFSGAEACRPTLVLKRAFAVNFFPKHSHLVLLYMTWGH